MSLKDRIEDNLTLFALGLLAAGFSAGLGAYKLLIETTSHAPLAGVPSSTSWADEARKENWVPKNECPAYPVSLSITSPGTGSIVDLSSASSLNGDLVVQASRPLPRAAAVGFVTNRDGDTNYYLRFPVFSVDEKNMIFRDERFFSLGFAPAPGSIVNFWAVMVDDKRRFGSVYSSLDQIAGSGIEVTLSPKVSVTVRKATP